MEEIAMKDDRTNISLSDWGIEATDADTSTEGIVIYTYPGGWEWMVKANRPVRNNNPGCLRYCNDNANETERKVALQHAKKAGALTIDEKGFGVFPDWTTGKRAADNRWQSYRTDNLTIAEAAKEYTKTGQEKRIDDLANKARAWLDRNGNPVTKQLSQNNLTI
jgi:hypothetical protein